MSLAMKFPSDHVEVLGNFGSSQWCFNRQERTFCRSEARCSLCEHRELFGNRQSLSFRFWRRFWMPMTGLAYRSIQMMPGLEHRGAWQTECWYVIAADEGTGIYGHNAQSKEELRQQIEQDWDHLFDHSGQGWRLLLCVEVAPPCLLARGFWFWRLSNLAIPLIGSMTLIVRTCWRLLREAALDNRWRSDYHWAIITVPLPFEPNDLTSTLLVAKLLCCLQVGHCWFLLNELQITTCSSVLEGAGELTVD